MRSSKYILFFNSLLFLIQIQFVRSQLTTNGLVLNLDASNPSSYSGSGSTWNDTSGNNKDFNINNLILLPSKKNHLKCGIIDFQSAFWGESCWDLFSLLEDSSMRLIKKFLCIFISISRHMGFIFTLF